MVSKVPHVPVDVAARIAGVTPATIRQWARRGQLTRYPDGFSVAEILTRLDTRKVNMIRRRPPREEPAA